MIFTTIDLEGMQQPLGLLIIFFWLQPKKDDDLPGLSTERAIISGVQR